MADQKKSKVGRFADGIKYVVGIEGSTAGHFKHRLNPWTIAKEVFNHFTDKVLPQGADETANALFNHSAYLPWPGTSGPKPIEPPQPEPAEAKPDNIDKHAALYGVSYDEHLDQAAGRGGNDYGRGLSY